MNDRGEINFYRYDMEEKTIQRYFEDPIAAGAVSGAEYQAAIQERDAALSSSNFRFIVICILSAVCFVLIMLIVYLNARLKNASRNRSGVRAAEERAKRRRDISDGSDDVKPSEEFNESELLKHDFDGEEHEQEETAVIDETQVIRRPERKRKARRVTAQGIEGQNAKDSAEEMADQIPEEENNKNDEGMDEI